MVDKMEYRAQPERVQKVYIIGESEMKLWRALIYIIIISWIALIILGVYIFWYMDFHNYIFRMIMALESMAVCT